MVKPLVSEADLQILSVHDALERMLGQLEDVDVRCAPCWRAGRLLGVNGDGVACTDCPFGKEGG